MKKYYANVDYTLHLVDFPHMGVAGAIAWNSDATAEIYINTLYNFELQKNATKHELRHFAYDHAYCDYKDVFTKESEADDIDDPNIQFANDFSWIIVHDESKIYAL